MSDRKRNEGWRADNPNRHKREIRLVTDIALNTSIFADLKRKVQKEKMRRKNS